MVERELWENIKKDDETALKHLFDLHYRFLCSYMVQFTNDLSEAEDIVQEVFIKVWTKRKSLIITTSLKSFLYRSAHNTYIDKYRKNKNKTFIEIDTVKHNIFSDLIDEHSTHLLEQKTEKIKMLINSLPKRCKEIVLLSKNKGLKNKEIADTLGISIKTVEAQLSIAFKRIREGFKI